MSPTLPEGVWPVMLTPFTEGGDVDMEGLDALTDWYVDAGVAGLFTVCYSSEMFDLADEERLAVAERVVDRADVPVVATGTHGGPIAEQAADVERMADTGVDAVVVNTARMADEDDDEAAWAANLEELLERTDAPLGFYECPRPYHRTLSPEVLGRVAETGRCHFLKDTCGDPETIAAKIAATADTPLGLYDANAVTVLESLRAGAAGYSGIAANVYPELLAWLCDNHGDERAAELSSSLTVADHAVRNAYGTSAKAFLAREGLPITTVSRMWDHDLSPADERTLAALAETTARWRAKLGIDRPRAEARPG